MPARSSSRPPSEVKKPQSRRGGRGPSLDLVTLPLVPVRDQVYFPHGVFSILIGRDRSVRAIEAAMDDSRRIALLTQRDISIEDPTPADMHEVGIVATVMQLAPLMTQ